MTRFGRWVVIAGVVLLLLIMVFGIVLTSRWGSPVPGPQLDQTPIPQEQLTSPSP